MASGESIRSSALVRVRAGLLGALALMLVGCSAPEYSSPAWSGRIVDLETGAPIEGAVVVVRWPVETFRGDLGGWLVMDEAVSDRDGIFQFKAWGPMRTPDHRGSRTRLSPNVPEFNVFKSAYQIGVGASGTESGYLDDDNYTGPAVRHVYADGKVFALNKFVGTHSQYGAYLDRYLPLGGPLCNYQLIPRMYAAVVMEDRRLKALTGHGIPNGSLQDLENSYARPECARSVLDSVQRYVQ